MDKTKVIRYLMSRLDYTNEQRHLIEAIEEARQELQRAREYFENVSEPKLVDYAIFMEEAAKVRYVFLLEEAKRLSVKVDGSYMLGEVNVG
jgi:hypothetical protein